MFIGVACHLGLSFVTSYLNSFYIDEGVCSERYTPTFKKGTHPYERRNSL